MDETVRSSTGTKMVLEGKNLRRAGTGNKGW
jgi:hypothetical protein